MHIADRVDVHHERHEAHHHHHRGRELVDKKADLKTCVAGRHPCIDAAVIDIPFQHIQKYSDGPGHAHKHERNGCSMTPGRADHPAQQPGDKRSRQRRQRH